jgi:hypothetical protein
MDTKAVTLVEKLKGYDNRSAQKTFLLQTSTGKKTRYQKYVAALKEISKGLETNGKVVTHRLRHSYATSLLNGGMSLVGIMKLLGHTDHRMTLRYAEITQETVGKEYFQALSQLENRYAVMLNKNKHQESDPEPLKMLQDVAHLMQKLSADDKSIKYVISTIVRRINRIQIDIEKLNL